jgi:hypothetical protein
MDHIEYPTLKDWSDRRAWFEQKFDVEARGGAYIVGEHASALLVDLQSLFCVGAFISAIIISAAIIDSHIVEVEAEEHFSGGMKASFSYSKHREALEWLRQERNALVHFSAKREQNITVDSHYIDRRKHEECARKAISLVADVLFEHPWT